MLKILKENKKLITIIVVVFAIIILGGVGGPFHSATVAVFSKLIPDLKSKPEEVVNRLYNTFLTTTFIIFALLAILGFLFADKISFLEQCKKNN